MRHALERNRRRCIDDLSWCVPDEQTPLSISVLDRLKAGEQIMVPAFWALEVLNSLLVGERRGRIKPDQTDPFLEAHRITPCDALYIELAARLGCPLATLDQAQRNVAATLGIECL